MGQIMQEAMFLRVYTIDGRYFLDGYALESLEKKELVEASNDQYYEFTLEEINQMISEYASINRYVELTPEFTQITKRALANVYGVIYEINDMFDANRQNNVRVEEQDTTKTTYK